MSSFTRSDFVEEFAFRTQSNYYSLMIAQAEKQNRHDAAREYKEKLNELKQEMTRHQYIAKDYFEITQLINSLIGLLIFPEQQYYEELEQAQLSMEKNFAALNRIIKSENYHCTYRKPGIVNLSDAQQKLNSNDPELLKDVFGKLPPEEKSPYNILRHMRNAVAHENVGIIPVSRGEEITSVIFKDFGRASLRSYPQGGVRCKKASYIPSEKIRLSNIRGNPLYGYFHIEIPVEDLETVLMEISNVILRIARKG